MSEYIKRNGVAEEHDLQCFQAWHHCYGQTKSANCILIKKIDTNLHLVTIDHLMMNVFLKNKFESLQSVVDELSLYYIFLQYSVLTTLSKWEPAVSVSILPSRTTQLQTLVVSPSMWSKRQTFQKLIQCTVCTSRIVNLHPIF